MRIDVYLSGDAVQLCCRLAERAYQKGLRVRIHTNNLAQSEQIDTTLWTFRSESFVPHVIGEDQRHNVYDITPVIIDHAASSNGGDVLINIATTTPPFFQDFQHVCDIVGDVDKAAGRKRYKYYHDNGCEMVVHQ